MRSAVRQAFTDQVGLEEESEEDVLQEEYVILVVGFFVEGEFGVILIVKIFQDEGGFPDAEDC